MRESVDWIEMCRYSQHLVSIRVGRDGQYLIFGKRQNHKLLKQESTSLSLLLDLIIKYSCINNQN